MLPKICCTAEENLLHGGTFFAVQQTNFCCTADFSEQPALFLRVNGKPFSSPPKKPFKGGRNVKNKAYSHLFQPPFIEIFVKSDYKKANFCNRPLTSVKNQGAEVPLSTAKHPKEPISSPKNVLEHFQTFRDILGHIGTFSDTFGQIGTHWNIFGHTAGKAYCPYGKAQLPLHQ